MQTHHHQPKLMILGRDGILNVFREDHVKAPDEWQPIEGALEAVAKLNQAGWHAVVATNQSGIGRGLLEMSSLNAVHRRMMQLLAAKGGRIDAVFICPHAQQDHCDCRKPMPGLMRQVAERYGIDDLTHVLMVCDTVRDVQAALAAGCEPHLVRTGRAAALSADELAAQPAQVHDSLAAFAQSVLKRGRQNDRGDDSGPGDFTHSIQ
jgi:D-glycero-D-manno-heptose 1,7-bisphosphate phosphatase